MKMVSVLIGVIAASATLGAARFLLDWAPPRAAPAVVVPVGGEVPSGPARPAGEGADGRIEGPVLEVINVPNYTYCRLGGLGPEGTWAAVPSTTLKVGDHVQVDNAAKMVDFKSSRLSRTFPVIYFGTLHSGAAPAAAGAAPPNDPHGGIYPHAGAVGSGGSAQDPAGPDPHQGIRSAGDAVPVQAVQRAPGPNGKTVAEVITDRQALGGKVVRIRATVVKSNPGILGRTYLHLRDGSGDAARGSNDIVATTEAVPAVGSVILIEGTVVLDREIGAGYKFPTLIQDAKVLEPGP